MEVQGKEEEYVEYGVQVTSEHLPPKMGTYQRWIGRGVPNRIEAIAQERYPLDGHTVVAIQRTIKASKPIPIQWELVE